MLMGSMCAPKFVATLRLFETNMQIPAIGSTVKVTTRYPNYVIGRGPWDDKTTTGKVVPIPSYWKDEVGNTFAIETGLEYHPISLVYMHRVIDLSIIQGKALSWIELSKSLTIKATVAGSKGNVYNVVSSGGKWSCTCTGFEFRNQCKHIAQVKTKIYGKAA